MKRKILLTGATKFLGKHVLRELLSREATFACLVRPHSNTEGLRDQGINLVQGDLNEPENLTKVLESFNTVINIPNLASIRDPKALVRAYEQAEVDRAIFISSTGIFTQLNAKTKPRRKAAEEAISSSELKYTILRPTLIYGTSEDENIARLLRFCQRFPALPVFGSGEALQQPIHVEDLAWSIVEVIDKPKTYCKAYNLGGDQVLSYNALVKTASGELGRKTRLVHIPTAPAAFVARLAAQCGIRLPVSEEQILRLREDKAYDVSEARADFGFTPRSFTKGVAQQVALLRGGGTQGLDDARAQDNPILP